MNELMDELKWVILNRGHQVKYLQDSSNNAGKRSIFSVSNREWYRSWEIEKYMLW